MGIGDWAQSPIPNPQSPIPNPQSPFLLFFIFYIQIKIIINKFSFFKYYKIINYLINNFTLQKIEVYIKWEVKVQKN